MDDYKDPYLRAAGQAIQAGDFQKARSILTGVLSSRPEDVNAWLLLSGAVMSTHEAVICLQNVLAMEPEHDGARAMLAQIETQNGVKPLDAAQVGVDSGSLGEACPYCLSRFAEGDAIVECPRCKTAHHLACWQENLRACAASNCDGFSVREIVGAPLPVQPPKASPKVVVITKDDIPQVTVVSRKQKEHRFQRQLLLRALMVEEGLLPPEEVALLPPLAQLLAQYQRDEAEPSVQPSESPLQEDKPAAAPAKRAPLASTYQASGIVQEVLSIWPDEQGPDAKEA